MDGNVGHSGEAADPPSWAQAILTLLLRPDDEESIARDLLEEYRKSRLPALGQRRADLWYLRQVAGLLGRASLPWAALLGALCSGRVLLDAFAPPTDWGPRSAFSTYSAIATYLLVGSWTAWRTHHVRTGTLVAVVAHVAGQALAIAVTFVLFFGIIRHDPRMLETFQRTGGFEETIGLPILLLPFVAAFGCAGGVLGKLLSWIPRRGAVA
jgi:hypothetical protein